LEHEISVKDYLIKLFKGFRTQDSGLSRNQLCSVF
jgi:hypothetical protein